MDEGVILEDRPAPPAEPPAPRRPPAPRWLVVASELSWRSLVFIAAIALIVWAAAQVPLVVVPVLLALLISTVLMPPMVWLCRRGVPRWLATLIVFLSAIATVGGLVALIVPPVVNQFDDLGNQINQGVEQVGDFLSSEFDVSQQEFEDQIDQVVTDIGANVQEVTDRVVSGALLAAELIGGLIITLFLVFFFLKDGPSMWRWIVTHAPRRRRETLQQVGQDGWEVLGKFVRGLIFVAAFDAVFIGLGLWAIGVPLVLPLAVLTFMLAFIPFVGAVLAGVAAALVALVAEGFGTALLVAGLVTLVQQVEGNLLYPLIVGRSVELHPAVILVVVTIGGLVFGIVGAFLAVPITAAAASTLAVIRRRAEVDAQPVVVARRMPADEP